MWSKVIQHVLFVVVDFEMMLVERTAVYRMKRQLTALHQE